MESETHQQGAYTITQSITCNENTSSDDLLDLRISAIFVILVGSLFGALFPVIAKRHPSLRGQKRIFFVVKYFGSGVIVSTAFIHLLAPANESLTSPCLSETITSYPWAEGIALMSVFALFLVELLATSFATFAGVGHSEDGHSHGHSHGHTKVKREHTALPGEDHLGHVRKHQDIEAAQANENRGDEILHLNGEQMVAETTSTRTQPRIESKPTDEEKKALESNEDYASQLISLFIFEFGVVFHSVIIGLTLAVTGENFKTLFIVLAFHQTFEGLALGTRLAVVPFSKSRRSTPYIMGVAYGLSTPLAIAIGLAARRTYSVESSKTLLVQGIFDAISAGILLYTGLIELMAHEFLYSETFRPVRRGKRLRLFAAYGCMMSGAGLMALLGYWA